MGTVIVSIILFVAILLVLVILAQNSKGGGLSSQFGGSSTSNMIGVKKTTDLLEKITWGLAIGMLALTMSLTFIDETSVQEDFTDKIPNQPELPSFPSTDPALESTDPIDGLAPADSTN